MKANKATQNKFAITFDLTNLRKAKRNGKASPCCKGITLNDVIDGETGKPAHEPTQCLECGRMIL